MNRRQWLSLAGLGAAAGAAQLVGRRADAQEKNAAAGAAAPALRGLPDLKITDVQCILTAPANIRLAVVKVVTSEPGLYGLGCATFTQRIRVVETAVNKYLKPFLVGKNPLAIEDLWQSMFVSSYWRNAAALNNAMSGVDMACWDILGKRAGMPVYQLIGGKCREAVDTYRHTSGATFQAVEEQVRKAMAAGYRHIRIQVAIPGLATYGAGGGAVGAAAKDQEKAPANARARIWEPGPYCRALPRLFEHIRKAVGDDVELLHDVHERVPPILAMQLCKDVEKFRPFFIEDPFSPEDVGYFKHLRRQTTTPIAMGELFNNPNEFVHLISERLIDFIRIHPSQVGGFTPIRKIAAFCEFFAVRTAWHGPGDVSPVGHMANVHLDLAAPNFGIQEGREFPAVEREVFPGAPEIRNGWFHANDKPGWGVDIDEKLAAKYPVNDDPPFDFSWGNVRRRDGTIVKP
jgi:mannonate dehydratase